MYEKVIETILYVHQEIITQLKASGWKLKEKKVGNSCNRASSTGGGDIQSSLKALNSLQRKDAT